MFVDNTLGNTVRTSQSTQLQQTLLPRRENITSVVSCGNAACTKGANFLAAMGSVHVRHPQNTSNSNFHKFLTFVVSN